MGKVYCVLTGDLLGSTKAGAAAVEASFATLRACFSRFEQVWTGADTRFTRYRGDGWQALIADPSHAPQLALHVISALKSQSGTAETRIAVGYGRVDHIGTQDLADAHGDAFLASGKALDAMPRGQVLALAGDGITDLHRALALLIGERTQKWSREQAEAVSLALSPTQPMQADIASRLGITVQAVNARLTSAGYQTLRQALDLWQANDRESHHG